MSVFLDVEGFIKPIVFLIASFVLLYVSYKKGLKYVLLAFIPILSMWFYEDFKEEVRIERNQNAYLVNTWQDVYNPLYVHATPNNEYDSDHYDEWILETENGAYNVRFHTGNADGYEMYDVVWEKESLIARKNVLEVMDHFNIKGTPIFNVETNDYTIKNSKNEYTITVNEKGRVSHVVDEDEVTIYLNEEDDKKPEGRPLTKEEVN